MAEPVIISATKQGGVENAYVVLQPRVGLASTSNAVDEVEQAVVRESRRRRR